MIVVPIPPHNLTSGNVGFGSEQDILVLVGPVLIGALCNWFLLGVLTMQLYVYYLCFPSDYWWIKLSAYGLYLLELGQTLLVTELAWVDLCAGWGMESTLMHIDWGFSMTPVANGIIACLVQTYFAWRVSALGRNTFWNSVAVVILMLSIAHATAAIIAGVKMDTAGHLSNDGSKLVTEIRNLFYLYLSAGAVSSFMIAASMLYFFISTKRRMAWSKGFDRRITKLIRSALQTGALCSVTAFIDLVIYAQIGHSFVHVAIVMVLSKLYSNAFMSSLNSRSSFYEGPSKSDSREENPTTTGRFHATQFTSVGIPVTDDSESVNGGDEPSTDLDYFKKGRILASTALSSFGVS